LFAVPFSLRLSSSLQAELRNAGFDLNKIKDPIFFLDGKAYVPLTPEIVRKLESGDIRV
jgi:hypothetical protein